MNINGEWELTPEEIAGLFEAKGWCYHTEDGLTIPSSVGVERMLAKLVKEALEDDDIDAVQGGRFMVWKDPELPNSYGLYLDLGYIWDEDALGAEVEAVS